MLTQNFGVTNKEHYGMLWYFWSGQFVVACQKKNFLQEISCRNGEEIRSKSVRHLARAVKAE